MASTDIRNVPATLIDAINGLPDAVFLVMDDGVIIAANTAAGEMFGYSQSQLLGSQVDELIPAGVRAYHQKVRTDAASDRRLRRFDSGRTFDCERRGGEVFQADVMLSPTRIDGVSMTWAIVRDLDAPNEADASREQELSALYVIGHMAASAFNLHHDFSKVAERLKEVIPHNRIGVALLCEDDPAVVEIAFLSGEDHPIFKEGERTPISSSATGRVVQTRARVSFTKAKTEFAPPAILAGLKQGFNEYCGAPLFDGDSVIGMMMLSTRDARGFSEFQKGLIDRLAKHLSVGIVNERMRGRLRAKTREIESIGEIGKKISSSPDLDAAFSAASESIRRLVPYDRLSIVSVYLGEGVVTGMFSDGELLLGFDMLTHDLPDETAKSLRKTFDTGRAMLFDQEAIAAVAESQPSFIPYSDAGYRWALVVPLLITQRPVGMMVYGRKDEDGYSEAQIALASRIGEQLAGPIANAFQLTRI